VFSELLGPLRLIKDQLSFSLNWTDNEILYMDGVVRLKEKQELQRCKLPSKDFTRINKSLFRGN